MQPCSVGPLSIEMIASRKSGPNPCVQLPRWMTSTTRPSVVVSGTERGRRVQARQRSISAIGQGVSIILGSTRDRVERNRACLRHRVVCGGNNAEGVQVVGDVGERGSAGVDRVD